VISPICGRPRRVRGCRSRLCCEGRLYPSALPTLQLIHSARATPDDSLGGDPDTSKLSVRLGGYRRTPTACHLLRSPKGVQNLIHTGGVRFDQDDVRLHFTLSPVLAKLTPNHDLAANRLFVLGYLELALADQFSRSIYDRSGPHIGKNQFRDNSTTTEGFG
jgi:hypothetical protein